jgi:hypothetical protein
MTTSPVPIRPVRAAAVFVVPCACPVVGPVEVVDRDPEGVDITDGIDGIEGPAGVDGADGHDDALAVPPPRSAPAGAFMPHQLQ